jgi:hypothetical protein
MTGSRPPFETGECAIRIFTGCPDGIKWKKNPLRHSYISYRLAEVKNIYQVAEECGNSPEEIKRSYREIQLDDGRVITAELAKEWFCV